jgi:hypothetical protein
MNGSRGMVTTAKLFADDASNRKKRLLKGKFIILGKICK